MENIYAYICISVLIIIFSITVYFDTRRSKQRQEELKAIIQKAKNRAVKEHFDNARKH